MVRGMVVVIRGMGLVVLGLAVVIHGTEVLILDRGRVDGNRRRGIRILTMVSTFEASCGYLVLCDNRSWSVQMRWRIMLLVFHVQNIFERVS